MDRDDAPSLPSRLAAACLFLLVLAMPLVPGAALPVAKHAMWLALAALGMACVWSQALSGRRSAALGTPVDLALGIFLAAALPASLVARQPGAARYELGLVLAAGLTYVLTIKTMRTPRDVARLALGALAAATVISIVGLLGYREFIADQEPEIARSARLATPFFAHSYLAAQYLVMVAAGGLVLVVEGRLTGLRRALLGAALFCVLAFLLVIGSRGAWLALLVALVLHVGLRARAAGGGRAALAGLLRRSAVVCAAAAALLAAASLAGLLPGAVGHAWERVLGALDPQDGAPGFSRLAIWRDTLRMGADHLIFGVGPGGFDTAFLRYHVSQHAVPHAHNQFLNVLAELGLVGLVAFAFLLRQASQAARKGAHVLARDEQRRALFHAGVAALVAALIYFLFETPLRWAEAGSLIMVVLAVVTRAGCTSRAAPGRPGPTLAALALCAVLLGVAWPTWVAFGRAAYISKAAVRHQERALELAGAGDIDAARRQVESALAGLAQADEIWPWRSDFVALRAELLAVSGRHEEALAAARLADLRVPGSFRHQFTIGVLLMRLQRPAEATAPLRGALAAWQGPESLDAYVLLGRAYYNSRQYEEAWLVFFDLLVRRWHHQRPELLLDAARCLLNLDRNLDQAATMLVQYRQRAGAQTEHDYVDTLEAELAERRLRPRRAPGHPLH